MSDRLVSPGQMGYYASWFLSSKVGRKKPLVNTMIINFNCNLRCKHCALSGNSEKLPSPFQIGYEDAVREMREHFEKGARILFFEGGEPTIWKSGDRSLRDLIQAGREIGYFVIGYTTNGTNPIIEDSDVISVSLDGPRETHDLIRGEGVYDALMANLDRTKHPNIFANMTVMRHNMDRLRETAEIVSRSKRIKGLMVNFITPPPYDIALSLDEKRKVVEEAIALRKEGYPILNTTRALKDLLKEDFSKDCPYWVSAFVLPDGSHHNGCPMHDTESCKKCGFDAVREYRLIVKGSPGTIRQMSKRFAYSKQ
jgi:MoaA/NifB/PqqE/SkfB family radical SAM enzyme